MDPFLPIFILIPLVGGSISGLISMTNNPEGFRIWYQSLKKAPWNPPRWVFGPVWTILYLLMGYASYRVLASSGSLKWTSLSFFWAQLVFNFLWSPIFFRFRKLKLALYVMVILLCLVVTTTVLFSLVDAVAAGLLGPYLIWVSYALSLNVYIVNNNDLESLEHHSRE
jgi:tryptophan-rich sensory protein